MSGIAASTDGEGMPTEREWLEGLHGSLAETMWRLSGGVGMAADNVARVHESVYERGCSGSCIDSSLPAR